MPTDTDTLVQTETITESEFPNFLLNLDFENVENETPSKIIFRPFLFAPFVDSYYSHRGPHDRTPGRFYYCNY